MRRHTDGAQRRSTVFTTSATLSYPIPEAPEHRSQLGDLLVYQEKPILTANDALLAAEDYTSFLHGQNDSI